MQLLENTVRDYPWGSPTVIPQLLGRRPDGTPQAELWVGAHAKAPSRLLRAPAPDVDAGDATTLDEHIARYSEAVLVERATTLDEHIAHDPNAALGAKVVAAFGPRLPFLLKVLAVEEPLSLQAHPTRAQARAGFAAEERAGVDPSAPERTYGDDNHKPELLCAVTDFEALCGFRPVPATLDLLRSLDVPGLRADVVALATGELDLRGLVERWLRLAGADRRRLVTELRAACSVLAASGAAHALEATTIGGLAQRHPDDGGVLVALLLNRLRLHPGEAVYLPAGNLHAYLHGTGIEVMASSDNVLRGGLTSKHVDIDGLLSVLDAEPGAPAVVHAVPTAHGDDYPVPVPDFLLSVLRPGDGRSYVLPGGTPQLLLVVEGTVRLTQEGADRHLEQGQSAFVGATEPAVGVDGSGVLVRATVGEPLGRPRRDQAG